MKKQNFVGMSSDIIDQINWDKVEGLLPVIVQSSIDKEVLMLGYMNREALKKTCTEGIVCFYSRTKKRLWIKGECSGNKLDVNTISLDCDKDTLLIEVNPRGPICHTGNKSCFSDSFITKLEDLITTRKIEQSPQSYVYRLMKRGTSYIAQKIGEEGVELALASQQSDKQEILEESADLLFHMLVNLNHHGLSFKDIEKILKARNETKHGIH